MVRRAVAPGFGIEARNSGQAVHRPAREDILTNGKEDGATKLLHKEHPESDQEGRQRAAKRPRRTNSKSGSNSQYRSHKEPGSQIQALCPELGERVESKPAPMEQRTGESSIAGT